MKLTKSQQLYVTVLGLCVVGFGLDRTVFRPADAAADEDPDSAASLLVQDPTRPLDTEALMRGISSPEATLAARFGEIAETLQLDPLDVHDAFQAPSAWMPEDPVQAVPEWAETAAEKFQREHRLTAVMANGDEGWAIIDGERLRVGEELDGFRLVSLRAHTAVLEAGGAQVELSIAR